MMATQSMVALVAVFLALNAVASALLPDAVNVTIGLYDNIQATWNGGTWYYDGTISAANPDGTYAIHYADGTFAPIVTANQIIFESRTTLNVGDSVMATWNWGSIYYTGQVAGVNGDGSYAVAYSDNSKASNVNQSQIFLTTRAGVFGLSDKVAARWKFAANSFYPGKISGVNSNGTFNIAFDDGTSETSIPPSWIILLSRYSSFAVGDMVSATWKGGCIWYPGVISQTNSDGTYGIKFNDGDYGPNQPAGAVILVKAASRADDGPRKVLDENYSSVP
jgi:hypothetical protein